MPHAHDIGKVSIHHGDCIEEMRSMPAESVDAVVCDPPYGIGFMGKEWDGKAIAEAASADREKRKDLGPASESRPGRAEPRSSSAFGSAAHYAGPVKGGNAFQTWCEEWAREAYRVLKPGGHLLAFGGSRTFHRLTAGIEDAGFEIRDCLSWLYGSGFPKSLDVSKAIDKAAGAEREIVGVIRMDQPGGDGFYDGEVVGGYERGDARTRPVLGGPATDAAREWQGWGTALKPAWEPCVMARKPLAGTVAQTVVAHGTGALNIDACRIAGEMDGVWGTSNKTVDHAARSFNDSPGAEDYRSEKHELGRWPANVVVDDAAAEQLGTPSRFFYCAKASAKERAAGLDGKNVHPTVKPVTLMEWLLKMVTPPGGTVLDPFAGSGSTGVAAMNVDAVGHIILIEREAEYMEIIRARVEHARSQAQQLTLD